MLLREGLLITSDSGIDLDFLFDAQFNEMGADPAPITDPLTVVPGPGVLTSAEVANTRIQDGQYQVTTRDARGYITTPDPATIMSAGLCLYARGIVVSGETLIELGLTISTGTTVGVGHYIANGQLYIRDGVVTLLIINPTSTCGGFLDMFIVVQSGRFLAFIKDNNTYPTLELIWISSYTDLTTYDEIVCPKINNTSATWCGISSLRAANLPANGFDQFGSGDLDRTDTDTDLIATDTLDHTPDFVFTVPVVAQPAADNIMVAYRYNSPTDYYVLNSDGAVYSLWYYDGGMNLLGSGGTPANGDILTLYVEGGVHKLFVGNALTVNVTNSNNLDGDEINVLTLGTGGDLGAGSTYTATKRLATSLVSGVAVNADTFSHAADFIITFTQTIADGTTSDYIAVRYYQATDYFQIRLDSTGVAYLLKYVGGVSSTLINCGAGTSASGKVHEIICRNSVWKWYVDGVLKGTATDSAFVAYTAGSVRITDAETLTNIQVFPITLAEDDLEVLEAMIP